MPETRFALLRRGCVFVDEASEYVSPPNTVKSDDGIWFRWLSEWRLLVEGTVGAMSL